MSENDIIRGIQQAGRFDATAVSEAEALRIVRAALPQATELPRATAGRPYPSPSPGVLQWFQVHAAEPTIANDLPHVKYADWTKGKKGRGGSWGHIWFPGTNS
jgi:hypothetical protein